MKCHECGGTGKEMYFNGRYYIQITCRNCGGKGIVTQTNEEWFCGLDTRLKAEAIFVFMDSVSKQINGEPITNKEEIIDKVIMRWLKDNHEDE